jgi:hypothetical protein
MKTFRVYNICWDTDDDSSVELPQEVLVSVPNDIVEDEDDVVDFISDYLSDTFGFCHKGFKCEENKETFVEIYNTYSKVASNLKTECISYMENTLSNEEGKSVEFNEDKPTENATIEGFDSDLLCVKSIYLDGGDMVIVSTYNDLAISIYDLSIDSIINVAFALKAHMENK